jgi:hypothetical protein
MGIHTIVRADLAAERFNQPPAPRTLLLEPNDVLHRHLHSILNRHGHVLLDGRRTNWAMHAVTKGYVSLVILNVGWPGACREIVEEAVWRALSFFVYAQTGGQLWELRRLGGTCIPEPFALSEIAERVTRRQSPEATSL